MTALVRVECYNDCRRPRQSCLRSALDSLLMTVSSSGRECETRFAVLLLFFASQAALSLSAWSWWPTLPSTGLFSIIPSSFDCTEPPRHAMPGERGTDAGKVRWQRVCCCRRLRQALASEAQQRGLRCSRDDLLQMMARRQTIDR